VTLADLQPYVDRAVTALEWNLARARRRQGLTDEIAAIQKALPLAGSYGVEREPLEARLAQIAHELDADVTEDQVSPSPLRSVPMDLVTAAVVRRILRLPAAFPILSVKTLPAVTDIEDAVRTIAMRWRTPHGELTVE